MSNSSRIHADVNTGGGGGRKTGGSLGGDPSPSCKIQADFDAMSARFFWFTGELWAFPFSVRVWSSVRVPEHVLPHRAMVVRIAGRYPITSVARVTKVQQMILDFLGGLLLAGAFGGDDERAGRLLTALEGEVEV